MIIRVVIAHRGFNLRQARIEMFERSRIAFGVAAVAVKHVEVDQVGKDQTARVLLERMNRLVDRLLVVLRGQVFGHTHRIVDRSNLADANHVEIFILQGRQQIFARRRHGIVVTVLGAIEISGLAQKRPRDHASDFVFAIEYALARFRKSHKADRAE